MSERTVKQTVCDACRTVVSRREPNDGRSGFWHDDTVKQLLAEIDRLRAGLSKENDDVCQTLGKALGYPRYCDDQKNFPSATEADGVCVGEHVAASLAAEAAGEIKRLRADIDKALAGEKMAATDAALRTIPAVDALDDAELLTGMFRNERAHPCAAASDNGALRLADAIDRQNAVLRVVLNILKARVLSAGETPSVSVPSWRCLENR